MPKIKPKTKQGSAKSKVKKIKKISLSRIKKTEGRLIGKVSHYFSNIKVAVMNLSAPLAQGDEIRIIGGEATDFNQKVTSMQIDHKELQKAKKGDSIGFKTKEKVREGYKVYRR